MTRNRTRALHAALPICLLMPQLTLAEDSQDEATCYSVVGDTCLTADQLSSALDYGAPTSPLFTLMNTTPESVVDPRASEKWSVVLPAASALARDEAVSLGVSVNPGLLLLGDGISRREILDGQDRPTTAAWLSNLSLQAAYIRGDADPVERQFGLGLSWTYDANAPINAYRRFEDCIRDAGVPQAAQTSSSWIPEAEGILFTLLPAEGWDGDGPNNDRLSKMSGVVKNQIAGKKVTNPGAVAKALIEAAGGEQIVSQSDALAGVAKLVQIPGILDESFDIVSVQNTCLDKVLRWNRKIFSLGLAQYWSTLDGAPDRQGSGAWISYAFPLGEEAQGTVSGFWTDGLVRDSLLPDAADGTIDIVDSWGISGRYTHRIGKSGGAKITRGYLEAAYVSESFGTTEDDFYQLGLGAELAVQENVYMQIGYVDTLGSSLKDRGAEVNLGLNIAFSSASLFKGN
ncbi:hypothetical protein KM176_18960 [Pseudooceanicola sp. CBS1P-1]|uniref:Autotransporter domain-containing protein n=1 Tax=Pseudooceanicola albus TaxID=2692189 RepID=A0A6L7G8F2_9RHOB|nr:MULTISPECIES: hypothetical protein [Pseudooceanicola]MBT9385959.1 hypothetical protein [Pseudooceanicola endophyticus]MXN19620.1 hypothetical protein [Pseudooceanicola albus]